jgi:hypothetical protein
MMYTLQIIASVTFAVGEQLKRLIETWPADMATQDDMQAEDRTKTDTGVAACVQYLPASEVLAYLLQNKAKHT